MSKQFTILGIVLTTLFLALSSRLYAQNKAECIEVTFTGNYTDFVFHATGIELWIDLNHNGIQDTGEEVLSGEKSVKSISDRLTPCVLYGKTIEELSIRDTEQPDQIKKIGLAKASSLRKLFVNGNPLEGILDLKPCTAIEEVRAESSSLEAVDAVNCYSLRELYVSGSPKLKTLNLTDCNRLTHLEAEGCIIENPILRGDVSLSRIYLENNMLTELNIPMACANLKVVSVSNNPNLKELSIRALSTVEALYASRCGLSSMDLSRGPLLQEVDLSCNELKDLPLHVNPTRLKEVRIHQNHLSLEAMKKLIASLPADDKSTEEKRIFAINTLGVTPREANVCSKSAVALANSRGWDVYDYYGGTEQLYGGSADPIIDPSKEGFILTTTRTSGEELTIDLKGENLYIDLNGNNIQDSGEALEVGQNTVRLAERSIVTVYGSHITKARLAFNALTEVDFSQAPHIEVLDLNNNSLEYVDLSMLKNLTELDLSTNQMTRVLLPNAAPLTMLNLAFNRFASIELFPYTKLQQLWVNNNLLTAFNPQGMKALQELHIEMNQIGLKAMRNLVFALPQGDAEMPPHKLYAVKTTDTNEGNHIAKSMVATAQSKRWNVYNGRTLYEGEEDTHLGDHSECISLTFASDAPSVLTCFPKGEDCWIDLNGNDSCDPGEEVDATEGNKQQIALGSERTVKLYGKKITELRINEQMHVVQADASEAHSIELLWIRENELTEIKLPKGNTLKNLDLTDNKLSGTIDLTPYTALEEIFLVTNGYEAVSVNGLSNLSVLSLSENKLTSIDLSGCSNLKELYLPYNQLKSVDVSALAKLETLAVFRNQIKLAEMQKLISQMNSIAPSSRFRGKIFNVVFVKTDGAPSPLEQNEVNDALVEEAKAKQWTVNAWKEGGGVIEITASERIARNYSEQVICLPTETGWIIKSVDSFAHDTALSVYSLEGTLLYKGALNQRIELNTPLHRAVLYYGGESKLLIR